MPKYELKDVYISSYNTGGSRSMDDEFDFVSEGTQGDTQAHIPIAYEEIKVRYPVNDPKSGDALPSEEFKLNYEKVEFDQPDDAFVFATEDATEHRTPKGFEWIEIKAPPKPPADGGAAPEYDLTEADMPEPMTEDFFMM